MTIWTSIKKGLREFVSWSVAAICFFGGGFILAVPYTWLAGDSVSECDLTIVLLPLAVLFGSMLYGAIRVDHPDMPWWIGRAFKMYIIYCLLPIIMNGMSIMMAAIGFTKTANVFFLFRYPSFLFVPLFGIMGYMISTNPLWRDLFGRAIPPSTPSGTPPSGTSLRRESGEEDVPLGRCHFAAT